MNNCVMFGVVVFPVVFWHSAICVRNVSKSMTRRNKQLRVHSAVHSMFYSDNACYTAHNSTYAWHLSKK